MLTIGLEESLPKLPGAVIPSKLWSPYRLPLIRFLTHYPAERFGSSTNNAPCWGIVQLVFQQVLSHYIVVHQAPDFAFSVQCGVLFGVTKPVG